MLETVAILRRLEHDLAVGARREMCISIEADSGIHDESAMLVTERRQVGSAACETEPKRCSGSNTHYLRRERITHNTLA